MICLDTNYLILGLVSGSDEFSELMAWLGSGEPLVASMPAWYEFLCGPVTPAQVRAIRGLLKQIIPFGDVEAGLAAKLFNASGRKRSLRVDAMIAATAISTGAKFATNNTKDFAPFVASGLEFV